MTFFPPRSRFVAILLALTLGSNWAYGWVAKKTSVKKATPTAARKAGIKKASLPTKTASVRTSRNRATLKTASFSTSRGKKSRLSARSRGRRPARYVSGGPWLEPTFADSTVGDNVEGEDLTVRRAAVDALGPYNGTVVVADPQTGRVLTIVNQKTAFRGGFQPCSTVKIYAAMAGLNEGIIARDTSVRL